MSRALFLLCALSVVSIASCSVLASSFTVRYGTYSSTTGFPAQIVLSAGKIEISHYDPFALCQLNYSSSVDVKNVRVSQVSNPGKDQETTFYFSIPPSANFSCNLSNGLTNCSLSFMHAFCSNDTALTLEGVQSSQTDSYVFYSTSAGKVFGNLLHFDGASNSTAGFSAKNSLVRCFHGLNAWQVVLILAAVVVVVLLIVFIIIYFVKGRKSSYDPIH